VAPVVVGFDGSPDAARALAWACGAATARRLPLLVVTAVEGRRLPATSIVRPPTDDELEAALHGAQEEVDRLLAGLPEAPVDCTVVAVAGQPAAVLLEEAERADQLVVGSRGLGGFSRLLIGSVSSQVVHHARCPVTVVPPPAPDR
jgi:nucleotide-binding universal stress UspA family protein